MSFVFEDNSIPCEISSEFNEGTHSFNYTNLTIGSKFYSSQLAYTTTCLSLLKIRNKRRFNMAANMMRDAQPYKDLL